MTFAVLTTRNQQMSQETVDILKEYLERAERGEITAVAIAAIEPNGSAVSQVTATDYQVTLIGAVARLLHRMHIHADD